MSELVDISRATDVDSPKYIRYLKSLYRSLTPTKTSVHQWPPSSTRKVFNLAMIKDEKVRRGKIEDSFVRMTITGKVDDILHVKSRIELNEVFKEAAKQTGGRRKVVLMEGAPGCGKSTLSIFISQQWGEDKLFQEFKAVILVRLRDPAVQNAKRLADLFPSSEDSATAVARQALLDKMYSTNFQNILFILDGWDELPSDLCKNSILLDLVKPDLGQNNVLQESTVIVTSRPVASGDLHSLVSLRIEILGFTPKELKEYFSDCLDGDDEAVSLIEKLEENPAIEGTCRLPLNASILVHLYKDYCGKSLPTSQYGIFSLLICTCVSRHLRERTEYKDITFESLDQISARDITAKQFKLLCKLAYEGVMENLITFSSLPNNIDTLSLLQGVESFIEKAMSYNFIHLSIQEVLAAYYMTKWLTESEQVMKFKELFNQPRFSAVFQFYAAITKLKTSDIRDILNQIGARCGEENINSEARTLLISLLNCLNEAQDQSLCDLTMKHLQYGLNLGHKTVNPADCLSTGYFLSNVCKSNAGKFQVSLFNCSIDDQCCKYLVKGLQTYMEIAGESTTVLDVDLSLNCIGKEGGRYLSKLLQIGCVGALQLNGNSDLLDEGVKCISEQLSNNTLLKELGIYNCGITTNVIGDIATALMINKSLKVLNVGGNAVYDIGIQYLAHTLKFNQTLESLNLACCGMTDVGLQYIVNSLHENTSLTALKIYNFLHREHPNRITERGDAIQHLFSCLKERPTSLTLVLPMDFESSVTDIQQDINDARMKLKMAPIKILVEGYTLAEIKRTKEEEKRKEAQSSEMTEKGEDNSESEVIQPNIVKQDNTLEESDGKGREGSKPSTSAISIQGIIFVDFHPAKKSASFRYAEERAEIPFLHHQVLECDYRGLRHTVSDHDITLRVPEGAVPEGEIVHLEVGVTMYGPFSFPENTRPISPIIWLCLEEDYELKEKFEIYVPHFLMHLTEQRIQHHQVCFAKAHHEYGMEVKNKHDTSYSFRQFGSQPSFIYKDEKHYAVLTSKHCCFLCLSAQNARELAMDAGYCLVRIQPSPLKVQFLATFFLETCLNSIKEQYGIDDDQIADCSCFKFKENKEQDPYIRMVIPSELPNSIIMAKEPANLKIKASDIDFWNFKLDFMKLKHKMKMYPPRVKLTVKMGPSTHNFKLSIRFEGCSDEDLDMELIFPLESPIISCTSGERTQARAANAAEAYTEREWLTGKRKRPDSDEHTDLESCSKVVRVSNSPSLDEPEKVPEILGTLAGSKSSHNGTVHTEIMGSAASSSVPSADGGNIIPKILAQPTSSDLELIKYIDDQGQKKQLRIKISMCNKWRNIGHLLKIDKSILQAWATTYRDNPLQCIEHVMSHWLDNPTNEYPVSWEGLKALLTDVELQEVVNKLDKALKINENEQTMS